MRQDRQFREHALDDHAHIGTRFGRGDQCELHPLIRQAANGIGGFRGEFIHELRIEVELDDLALLVALQRLVEGKIPAIAETQQFQHAVLHEIAADLLRHAQAHMLSHLLGAARMGRDLCDGLENEMQVADRDPFGQKQFQHRLQA